MKLDKSWKKLADEIIAVRNDDNSSTITLLYLEGAKNYRDRAIKILQTVVDLNPYKEGNPYCQGIEQAIQVLKDLKAE